jgi:hypothetical protein
MLVEVREVDELDPVLVIASFNAHVIFEAVGELVTRSLNEDAAFPRCPRSDAMAHNRPASIQSWPSKTKVQRTNRHAYVSRTTVTGFSDFQITRHFLGPKQKYYSISVLGGGCHRLGGLRSRGDKAAALP